VPPVAEAGGPDAPSSDAGGLDASTDVDLGDLKFIGLIIVGPTDLCLGAGFSFEMACRVLLDGVMAGCSQTGLSPAAATDVAEIQAKEQSQGGHLPQGAVCQLNELGASTSQAGCADQSATGWCYVKGSCSAEAGSPCQQALCTTTGFDMTVGYVGPNNHPGYSEATSR